MKKRAPEKNPHTHRLGLNMRKKSAGEKVAISRKLQVKDAEQTDDDDSATQSRLSTSNAIKEITMKENNLSIAGENYKNKRRSSNFYARSPI